MNCYRRRILRFLGFLALLGVFIAPQYAGAAFTALVDGNLAATVDGNLAEWGVAVANTNNASFGGLTNDTTESGGTQQTTLGGLTMYYYLEDTETGRPSGIRLGPDYGGQDYDAEFMGIVISGNTVSIAIVSGQRPDNGLAVLQPGRSDNSDYDRYLWPGSRGVAYG